MVFLTIPALSLLFLQNRQVQTLVTKYVAERLSEELRTSISLSSINYSFFKRIHIQDLYLEDMHGDTLIYSELTEVRLKQIFSGKKGLEIKKITVENAWLNLVIDSSNVVNIKHFVGLINKPHVPPERKGRFHIAKIEMIDGRFSLSKMVKKESNNEINFTDYHLKDLQIKVDDLISEKDTVSMDIVSLALRETSGFEIKSLTSFMHLGKSHMHFSELDVLTDGSVLDVPELKFNFERFRDFKYFSSKVDWVFESNQSRLKIRDLAYHASATMGLLDHIDIEGKAFGKLNDLRGEDLIMTFDQNSTLEFDFVMIGLPQFKNTFLELNFRELNTSASALNDLVGEIQDTKRDLLYPWFNLGNLDFRGRFTGYPDDFVASGLLGTDMGRMVMDLSFKPDSSNRLKFNGHLKTNDFKLGAFLDQEEYLAELDMDVITDGSITNGQIAARLDGNIDSLEFYHYAYSNITLDGEFTNNTFDGGVSISDPNIKMDFQGKMDFSEDVPVYNFTADVARARPYYLKLGVEEPNTFASFLIETDISGKTLDELNGEVRVVNSLFSRGDAQVQLYDFNVSTSNTPDYSEILVNSEIFDAHIQGKYKFSSLPLSFNNLVDRYMNIDLESEPFVDSLTRFTYQFDFKHVNPLLDYFYPDLQIGDHSQLRGTFDPLMPKSTTYGAFTDLQFKGNKWANVEILTEIREDDFQLNFNSDSLSYGDFYSLVDHQFIFRAAHDTTQLDMFWDNRSDPSFKGRINLTGTLQSDSLEDKGFLIQIHPTELHINNDPWSLSRSSVLLRKKYLKIDSLMVKSRERYLLADGYISSHEEQVLNLEVNKMNLNELSKLAGLNAELTGNISGNANFQNLDGTPYIFSDLIVDTLIFNDQMLGTTQLKADWDDTKGAINMQLISEAEGIKILEVDGAFSPKNRKLDFDIHMDDFELQALNPYAEKGLKDLNGTIDVDLTLDGTLDKPELNGSLNLEQGEATITFLNTHYIFNDKARIYHNNVYLEDFVVLDEKGSSARISGTLTNSYFKDFRTNINIEANNLMCLNTTSVDNDVVYGSIFATGNVGINGPFDGIKIDVKATTEESTAIYLPLYTAREVQTSDFISFVVKNEVKAVVEPVDNRKIGGLEMELDLDITEEAKVQMIFDPKLGDIIETSGQGNLRILLDQTSGLTMFGDVELLKGDYLFTLQNVINKRFEIEQGGKIIFNGSPTDATIDLEAIYTTRTAPYNLYPGDPSEAEQLKKRIPVECRLNLLGELQSPIIATGIELPTADAKTRELLISATRTEEELMKQFISLLVINNFYSVSGYGGGDIGGVNSSVAGVTASELLSNQLTNWLSQISDDFDIGVNYRPGDAVTRDQVELALSTQMLNDRIIISGNVDVGGQETNPSSGAANNPYIMGDFDVEFKLTDNVSLLAFNRARDELLYETAPYKQGVGISYQEEFNSFERLRMRYREGWANRKKRRKKSKEPDIEE